MSAVVERAKVFELEEAMKREFPLIDVPVTHYFSHGVYGRRMDIKKGTVLTGKIHKFSQLNILMSGDVSVLTEGGVMRVQSPFAFVARLRAQIAAFD